MGQRCKLQTIQFCFLFKFNSPELNSSTVTCTQLREYADQARENAHSVLKDPRSPVTDIRGRERGKPTPGVFCFSLKG